MTVKECMATSQNFIVSYLAIDEQLSEIKNKEDVFLVHLVNIAFKEMPKCLKVNLGYDADSIGIVLNGVLGIEYTFDVYMKDKTYYSLKLVYKSKLKNYEEDMSSSLEDYLKTIVETASGTKFYTFGYEGKKSGLSKNIDDNGFGSKYLGLGYNRQQIKELVTKKLNQNKDSNIEHLNKLLNLELAGLSKDGQLDKEKVEKLKTTQNRLKEAKIDMNKLGFKLLKTHKYSNIMDVYVYKSTKITLFFTLNTAYGFNPEKSKVFYNRNSNSLFANKNIKNILATLSYYAKTENKRNLVVSLQTVLDTKRNIIEYIEK